MLGQPLQPASTPLLILSSHSRYNVAVNFNKSNRQFFLNAISLFPAVSMLILTRLIKVLKNLGSSLISEGCSCIATTPTMTVTATAYITSVIDVTTTTITTTTAITVSTSLSTVIVTTVVPITYQQVHSTEQNCLYDGLGYVDDLTLDLDSDAVTAYCLELCTRNFPLLIIKVIQQFVLPAYLSSLSISLPGALVLCTYFEIGADLHSYTESYDSTDIECSQASPTYSSLVIYRYSFKFIPILIFSQS